MQMASLAATNWPKPVVLVPCLSWSSATPVFTQVCQINLLILLTKISNSYVMFVESFIHGVFTHLSDVPITLLSVPLHDIGDSARVNKFQAPSQLSR